jgi:hypothetical protein
MPTAWLRIDFGSRTVSCSNAEPCDKRAPP